MKDEAEADMAGDGQTESGFIRTRAKSWWGWVRFCASIPAVASLMFFIVVKPTGAQVYDFHYSTADSILYWTSPEPDYILFRIRDGGASMEREANPPPGSVGMSDGTPGSVYVYSFDEYNRPDWHHSTDYGTTWAHEPGLLVIYSPVSGEVPGQCWSERGDPHYPTTLYLSSDSWQTFDSVEVNRELNGGMDSLSVMTLSHRIGTLYGRRYSDGALCVSSDSGQTWSVGSVLPWPATAELHGGAVDEIWRHYFYLEPTVHLAMDTGRTIIDSVFTSHPPARPWQWLFHFQATDLPGEAYLVAAWEDWPGDPHWLWTELIIYHIRNYGAQVDSFYYAGYDLNFENSVSPKPRLPDNFSIQAYPNPFNSQTTLALCLPKAGRVEVVMYDVLGRAVRKIADQVMAAGERRMVVNGEGLASGIYLVSVKAGEEGLVNKVVLLK